jgi:hypothetical protein
MNAWFDSWSKMATRVFSIPEAEFWGQSLTSFGIQRERSAVRLSHVWELFITRDRFHLPNGMSKGFAQWTLWRLDI